MITLIFLKGFCGCVWVAGGLEAKRLHFIDSQTKNREMDASSCNSLRFYLLFGKSVILLDDFDAMGTSLAGARLGVDFEVHSPSLPLLVSLGELGEWMGPEMAEGLSPPLACKI